MQDQSRRHFVAHLTGCQRRLFAFIFSLVPNQVEAEEILQQTNLKIWQRAEQYDPSRDFVTWACQIAYYETLYHRRHVSRSARLFDEATLECLVEQATESTGHDDARLEALQHCIERLNTAHRQLIKQRYNGRISVKDLAEQQNTTPGGLSQQLFRIRQSLLTCIQRRLLSRGDA